MLDPGPTAFVPRRPTRSPTHAPGHSVLQAARERGDWASSSRASDAAMPSSLLPSLSSSSSSSSASLSRRRLRRRPRRSTLATGLFAPIAVLVFVTFLFLLVIFQHESLLHAAAAAGDDDAGRAERAELRAEIDHLRRQIEMQQQQQQQQQQQHLQHQQQQLYQGQTAFPSSSSSSSSSSFPPSIDDKYDDAYTAALAAPPVRSNLDPKNASQIYAEGITNSLLAAERTYLAWIRTIISVVAFGLAIAKFFSPTNTLGSITAMLTTSAAVVFLVMCTQRYFSIVYMLVHRKFEIDRITPLLCTIALGSLLGMIIMGSISVKIKDCRARGQRLRRAPTHYGSVGGLGGGSSDPMSETGNKSLNSRLLATRTDGDNI